MISREKITVKVKAKTILDDISFNPGHGEITAVLGLNGSGKTTLLRVLSGNNGRYQGDVTLMGRNMKSYREKDRAKLIAYMPQVLPRPAIPVDDLISYGRFPYQDSRMNLNEDDRKACDTAVAMTKLYDKLKTQVCHLSGGERQLAYFAMVLAQDRDIILLDEPVSGLDTTVKKDFYRIIRELRNRGKTIVLTIHDINDAVDISDTICVMDNGKMIFKGTGDEFCDSGIPESVFNVKKYTVTDENGNNITMFR